MRLKLRSRLLVHPLALCVAILVMVSTASAEWKEKVLYSFQGGTDGATPAGGVVFDKAGNLYGTTTDGGSGGTNSIQDDLSGTATRTTLTDSNVGIYILGEPVQAGGGNVGYSRFTTSPNASTNDSGAVTWFVGSSPPPIGGSCVSAGSLYSCTNGNNCTADTLYGCEGSSGWKGIK
jgi:hypothetical protein